MRREDAAVRVDRQLARAVVVTHADRNDLLAEDVGKALVEVMVGLVPDRVERERVRPWPLDPQAAELVERGAGGGEQQHRLARVGGERARVLHPAGDVAGDVPTRPPPSRLQRGERRFREPRLGGRLLDVLLVPVPARAAAAIPTTRRSRGRSRPVALPTVSGGGWGRRARDPYPRRHSRAGTRRRLPRLGPAARHPR